MKKKEYQEQYRGIKLVAYLDTSSEAEAWYGDAYVNSIPVVSCDYGHDDKYAAIAELAEQVDILVDAFWPHGQPVYGELYPLPSNS